MNNIDIIGYKRTVAGKIGGAFERVEEAQTSAKDVAGVVTAMLATFGASTKIMIQMRQNGNGISIAPEHDEAVHGFESHPFQIAVTPVVGASRFTGPASSMVVSLEDAGAAVAQLAT